MTPKTDARHAAVTALLRIQEQGGYSNIVLDELLERLTLSPTERAMTARLVYGVTERRLTIDYLLNKLSSTPVKQMSPAVREILRVGVYQLRFTDGVPAFAAINECVSLTRAFGCGRLSGFVNGVLRAVQREADRLLSELPDTDKGLEIRYSCPRAHIRAWRQAYGDERMRGLLDSLNDAPPAYIRVNTTRTTAETLTAVLTAAGVTCTPIDGLPNALCVSPAQALHCLPDEIKSHFYFQDAASQWCCFALGAQPNERVADVCAAPGGKSLTVAQYMNGRGMIEAADLYEQKCATINRRAAEYGLTCIRAVCRDATQPPADERLGQFDRVICDAPCSGMGVVRRKPEIRYKDPTDFSDLPALQLEILSQAAKLVRVGGVLQYSTCTLRPEENEQVAEAFLASHPAFSPRLLPLETCFAQAGLPVSHQITLFPHIHGTDGFYIAAFERTR